MRTMLRSNIDRSNKTILSAMSRRAEMLQKQQEEKEKAESPKSECENELNEEG